MSIEFLRGLAEEHKPTGWPAVRMDTISAALAEYDALRAQVYDLHAALSAVLIWLDALRAQVYDLHVALGAAGSFSLQPSAFSPPPPPPPGAPHA